MHKLNKYKPTPIKNLFLRALNKNLTQNCLSILNLYFSYTQKISLKQKKKHIIF